MDNYALLSPRYVGFYAGRTAAPYQPGVRGPGFVTHSTWFQTLAEGGLLTAVPFFGMLILAWFCTMRVKRSKVISGAADQLRAHATALQGMLIGIVITSTFGSHMKIDFVWWYAGLASALVLIMEQEKRAARRIEASQVAVEAPGELVTVSSP